MKNTGIEFKNVGKSFFRDDGSEQVILDKVNFKIPSGKTTVVAGEIGRAHV